jgi:O-antigen ligase
LIGGIALLGVLHPPQIGRRPARTLDVALALSVAAIALQLVPLSAALRSRLAPAALSYDRVMRFDGAGPGDVTRPLSIDPAATLVALAAAAALVLLFWCARSIFDRGGVRATIRGIAWVGLFVTPLAIVQHAMPVPLLDQAWGLTTLNLRPYGPFISRNDFAAWLIMAIPLTLGYAVTRLQSRHRPGTSLAPEATFDSTSIWLGLAASLMVAGLLVSQSRSALVGAAAAAVFAGGIARRRFTLRRAAWVALGLAVMLVIAAIYADMGAVATRFEGTFGDGLSGRLLIWRQTVPLIRDFWPFGTGAGTYQTAMVLYQTMSRYFYVTHADNEVLQILAEGGVLLGLPVAVALVAGAVLVFNRLREDRTAMFWLRAGAATGIVALSAQNLIEMTVRVPANAVLFAVLAAIAVHDPRTA